MSFVTLAEYMERSRTASRWIVPGLLAGPLALIAGKPMAGKTGLALDLIAALTTGGDFLGHKATAADGPVMYLGTDPGFREEVAERLPRRGIDPARLIVPAGPVPRADDATAWKEIAEKVETSKPALVVIDNLAGGLPRGGSINSDADVDTLWTVLRPIHAVASTVVLAHQGKGAGGPEVTGSQRIEAEPRSVLIIERRGGLLHVAARGNRQPAWNGSFALDSEGVIADHTAPSMEPARNGERADGDRRAGRDRSRRPQRGTDLKAWVEQHGPFVSLAKAGEAAWAAGVGSSKEAAVRAISRAYGSMPAREMPFLVPERPAVAAA